MLYYIMIFYFITKQDMEACRQIVFWCHLYIIVIKGMKNYA